MKHNPCTTFILILLILFNVSLLAQFTNVPITNTSNIYESETAIAVNPNNENNLIVGWNDFNTNPCKPGFAISTNSGTTWSTGVISPPNQYYGFDPSVAYDLTGKAYYCYVTRNTQAYDYLKYVYLSKTTNQGTSWTHTQVSINPATDKS